MYLTPIKVLRLGVQELFHGSFQGLLIEDFLSEGVLQSDKQGVVCRGQVRRIGRVGKNVPSKVHPFLTGNDSNVWPGAITAHDNCLVIHDD